jgi:hypothetical protein
MTSAFSLDQLAADQMSDFTCHSLPAPFGSIGRGRR